MRTLGLLLLASSLLALDPPGEPAPKFRAKTLDGESIDNESLKGKTVLIQFWTTWCGVCRSDEPFIEALNEEFKDKLMIVAVSVNEPRGKVRRYVEESGRKSRIVVNEDTNLPSRFQVEGFPSYVVLSPKGTVAATHLGSARSVLYNLLEKGGLRR